MAHALPGLTSEAGVTRLPDFQGLRALAELSVVAFHVRLNLPSGFVGVDVVFETSAFVFAAVLARELATSSRVSFRCFHSRRFKRPTSALARTVTVTLLPAVVLQSPFGAQQVTAVMGVGAMLSVANVATALV